ncbi:hypothetical protein [Coxiella-like endosymbiont]|nr:hypothetical protein [Coxiella-like endosymbiont]
MIKAAEIQGWLDETAAMVENLVAIKRAGRFYYYLFRKRAC